jgi:hypothetical protein
LVVVLAVATLVTAVVALRARTTTPPVGAPAESSASGEVSSPSTVTPSPTVDGSQPGRLVEPPLVMASRTEGYRAEPGSCLGGGAVLRTDDQGRSWRLLGLDVSSVLALASPGAGSVEAVVTTSDACDAVGVASSDAGRSWTETADTSWHRFGDDVRLLHTPTGSVGNPCPDPSLPVVELQGLSTTDAAVLCPGGQVLRTLDGRRFRLRSTVPAAMAMAFDSRDLGWLLVRDGQQCPAYVLKRSQDGGVTWAPGGCVGSADALASASPPALAFSDAQHGLATIGDVAYSTADGGFTWQQAVTRR